MTHTDPYSKHTHSHAVVAPKWVQEPSLGAWTLEMMLSGRWMWASCLCEHHWAWEFSVFYLSCTSEAYAQLLIFDWQRETGVQRTAGETLSSDRSWPHCAFCWRLCHDDPSWCSSSFGFNIFAIVLLLLLRAIVLYCIYVFCTYSKLEFWVFKTDFSHWF